MLNLIVSNLYTSHVYELLLLPAHKIVCVGW